MVIRRPVPPFWKVIVATFCLVAFCAIVFSQAVSGKGTAGGARAKTSPLQLVQAGKYAEALPGFKAMSAKDSRDPSINYYLGVCAQGTGDYPLAELAFSRVIVGTSPGSPFVPLARQQLRTLPHHYQPQYVWLDGGVHRWGKASMPLRVYISDGRSIDQDKAGRMMLPDAFGRVVEQLRGGVGSMPISRSYKPSFFQYTAEGLRAWDWAAREKLVSYTYTRDPAHADIVVLYSEEPTGWTQWPPVPGQPILLWIGIAAPNPTEVEKSRHVRAIAAHEFGHCLGLNHSPAKGDLMEPFNLVPTLDDRQSPETMASPNDKESLRALYTMTPDMVFTPAR